MNSKVNTKVAKPTKTLPESPSLQSSDSMKDALISSIGDGVIIVNEYGIITDINLAALRLLGYKKKDVAGKWLPDTIPLKNMGGEDIPANERTVTKALIEGKAVTELVSYEGRDGRLIPVSTTASPLMVRGKPTGAVIVFRDFSHELRVDKAKDEFVSFASHQLRTPLTAVKMYAEILKDPESGKLSNEQSLYLDRIENATKKMIELVSDFLNISKLELGNLEIKPKTVDISEIIQIELDELLPIAAEKGVSIDYSPDNATHCVEADPQLIRQVLHNLLTNALRYTSLNNGKIKIYIKQNANRLVVAISDNGIGIPDNDKDKIFERFFRAENATEHDTEGTGLGLYLSRLIAEASAGRLWFKSHHNKGTTFFLSLPTVTTSNKA